MTDRHISPFLYEMSVKDVIETRAIFDSIDAADTHKDCQLDLHVARRMLNTASFEFLGNKTLTVQEKTITNDNLVKLADTLEELHGKEVILLINTPDCSVEPPPLQSPPRPPRMR